MALDGSGDFTSVQAAIAAAPTSSAGKYWTIRIQPGRYHERIYVQREKR